MKRGVMFQSICVAFVLGGILAVCLADAGSTRPATRPISPEEAEAAQRRQLKREQGIATLEKYYADLYAQPLTIEKEARLAHLIAVVSLSRIDGQPLTKHLLTVLKFGKSDPMVARMAWEALHARHQSLTPEQREQWLDGGLLAAEHGGFPGELAAPLVAALASRKVDDPKRLEQVASLLNRIAAEADPFTLYGRATLEAAARSVATWSEPKIVEALLKTRGGSPAMTPRIDLMLNKLPSAPVVGNSEMGAAIWQKWFDESKLKPPATMPAYTGATTVFAAPERIIDPFDAKWRQESEIGDLRLGRLDAAICVDATGSMMTSIAFVTGYLETALKALRVITPTIRAGTVYYRHEEEEHLQAACCKGASSRPGAKNFTVRILPFTNDIPGLVRQMRQPGMAGGGHNGGAYYAGIRNAARILGPARKDTVRVIIVTGDTSVTQGSDQAVEQLAHEMKKGGFIIPILVQSDQAAKSVAPAARILTGRDPIVYDKDLAYIRKPNADPLEGFGESSFGQMVQQVITAAVPPAYADRVEPIFREAVKVLQADARAQDARERLRR